MDEIQPSEELHHLAAQPFFIRLLAATSTKDSHSFCLQKLPLPLARQALADVPILRFEPVIQIVPGENMKMWGSGGKGRGGWWRWERRKLESRRVDGFVPCSAPVMTAHARNKVQ